MLREIPVSDRVVIVDIDYSALQKRLLDQLAAEFGIDPSMVEGESIAMHDELIVRMPK